MPPLGLFAEVTSGAHLTWTREEVAVCSEAGLSAAHSPAPACVPAPLSPRGVSGAASAPRFFLLLSPPQHTLHGSGHQNHLSVRARVYVRVCVASCGAYKPFYKPDYTLIDAWIGAALCVYAPQPHRPGKDFLPLRAGYAEINVNRMDLIICVLGLLALIVEGIRCQGVYGECVQFFIFINLFFISLLSPAETKRDHDLVKQWSHMNPPL